MGHEVDGRADLYSLGIILFQMLTATTPFQGETPMQIAAQQLHAQPPAPRRFRIDLPPAAEQVILKALSKRPADRYANGLELATAFRLSLSAGEMQSAFNQTNPFSTTSLGGSGTYSRRGLFDPKWQTASLPSIVNEQENSGKLNSVPMPAQDAPVRSTGLLSRTGMFPKVGSGNTGGVPAAGFAQNPATPASRMSTSTDARQAVPTGFQPPVREYSSSAFAPMGGMIPATPAGGSDTFAQSNISQMSPSMRVNTGALTAPNYEQGSQTVKLTGPVKVVQVPVAPGRYVTGLLPVPPATPQSTPVNPFLNIVKKTVMALAVVLLLLGGTLGFLAFRAHNNQRAPSTSTATTTNQGAPNLQATLNAQATATATANTILSDPLSSNIRNLPTGASATRSYAFKNGAYHITNLGNVGVAVVVQYNLPNVSMAYQITMQEFRGDDASPVNSFGIIFRYNQQTKGNQTVSTFYSFEVVNTPGGNGKYIFYRYDSSKTNPWMPLWSQNFGGEFHEGHAPNSINPVKVIENGSSFSFVVNGKVVGKPIVDKTYTTGYVGMLVNLNGTEVAYSNLLITSIGTHP